MRLQTQLLLAVVPLAAGLALLGFVSLRTLDSLGRSSQRILQDNYRSVLAAQRMKDALEQIERRRSPEAIAQFESELKAQEANITEPEETEFTARLRQQWTEYKQGAPKYAEVRDAAQHILEINQDAMVQKSDEARRVGESNRALLLFSTLCALGLGVLASVALTRRALRPLQALSTAVRRIGEGDLDARALLRGEDEIAQVGRELDVMADKLREYRNSSLGELLQAQQASQAAIDSLPDPVLVLSVDGKVLNVNQAAETLLQIAAGAEPLQRIPAEVREAVEKVRAHVIGGKGPYAPRGLEEAVHVHADGGDRALLPRATPLYSETGGVIGATIVLQDVTRLLRFDELKNDLVATVAHEFRTPLTSLRMAIHVLIEGMVGPLGDRQLEMLHAARDDCERLQGIVDDLLDLARIQAGKVEVSLAPLPAKTILDAAVSAKKDAAHDAGVRIEESLGEPVLPVLVDPERIGLVFDNLIGNAIRHSPARGRIEVRAEPDGQAVRFEVQDEGPGIAPEYRQRIFEKFFRVPGTKGEGVGLGLYISREIVLAHGGDMGVDSEPGRGSRFWFTLRVPAA